MNKRFSIVPFDLKYKDKIESGEYLVTTRGDNPVRIVCWDKLDPDYPIIGLQRIGNFEFLENYNKDGRIDLLTDNDSDLMVLIDNEPLFVDLGLPSGNLWATRNIDLTQRNGFARSQYQYECSFLNLCLKMAATNLSYHFEIMPAVSNLSTSVLRIKRNLLR